MIHPTALVDDHDSIGPDTNVWAYAHVMAGARVGARCNLGDHTFVESGAVVGSNVTVKNQVLIWDGVTIEDNVFIGPGVIFTNDVYPRSPRMERSQSRYAEKANWLATTVVERGCSIGAAAIICPGIRLGRFAMIAAGSVVTKDVAPYELVRGNPGRHVGYVCGCGQKLEGHFLEHACASCGETAESRRAEHASAVESCVEV